MSKKLIDKVSLRVNKMKDNTFILDDFNDFIEDYDYDQVLRSLRNLVQKGVLIKISQGVYAKTRVYPNGKKLLCSTLKDLTIEALNKLGIKTDISYAEKEYNNGKTTQLPNGRVIAVNKRVRRKFSYNGYSIEFEMAR